MTARGSPRSRCRCRPAGHDSLTCGVICDRQTFTAASATDGYLAGQRDGGWAGSDDCLSLTRASAEELGEALPDGPRLVVRRRVPDLGVEDLHLGIPAVAGRQDAG